MIFIVVFVFNFVVVVAYGRHWREEEDTASSSSELITPELRQHVAKKLSKFLDNNYVW